MKKTYLKSFCARFLTLLVLALMSTNLAWGEDVTLASWIFESGTAGTNYPSNKTNFNATDGVCKSGSTFYLDGTGSQWHSSKGYAFTAVTSITITLKAAYDIKAGKKLTFTADMFYNKSSNAPATGYSLTVSENSSSYSTTGLDVTSISLSNSSENKTVTYTLQNDLQKNQTVALKYTGTGKAGSGQAYFNNISITGPSEEAPDENQVATPTIKTTETKDLYFDAIDVTLSTETAGASIYYTIDGTIPSETSNPYTEPFSVSSTTTVKAIAIKSGLTNSSVASQTFTFGPVFSSLEDLVADENLKSGDVVKVSFENAQITSKGSTYVYLNVKKGENNIEIYSKGNNVPTAWEVGGKLSGTIIAPWEYYETGKVWELCPTSWDGITYTEPSSEKYSIKIDPNIQNGTVVVSGNITQAVEGTTITLVPTPSKHYLFETWNVYETDNADVKVPVTDNKFTMPAYNVTVSATFTEIPTHIVQFYVNGELVDEESVYEGDEIEFPEDPTDIGTKKFVGWTKDPMDEICDDAPDLVKSATMDGEALNFYAVFANIEEVPVSWNKVTTLAGITEGTYVLVSEKTTNTFKYMPNTESSGSNPTLGGGITINNDVLTNEVTDEMTWSLVSTGTDNEFYIRPYGNATIGLGTTNQPGTNIRISSLYKNTKWTIAANEKANWQIKNNNTTEMYLAVYADDAWRNYSSSTTNQNGKFYFFKKKGGTVYSNYCTDISYTRTVNTDNIGTLCVPYAFEKPDYMTLYNIVGKDNSKIYFEENTEDIVAGKPYLFRSTEGTITLTYTGEKATEAKSSNGLVGTFDGCTITPNADNYILSNNTLYIVNGDFTCGANRAYIHIDGVSDYNPTAKADFTLDFNDPTGIESIDTVITEGSEIYNLNGMRVNNSYKGIVIVNGKKYINK